MIEVSEGTTTVTFDESVITIRRRPRPGMSLIGEGDTVIPLRSVQSIDFKQAGRLSMGHLRFSVAGSQGAAEATPVNRDPHAVAFTRKHAAEFEKLRDTIQAAWANQ